MDPGTLLNSTPKSLRFLFSLNNDELNSVSAQGYVLLALYMIDCVHVRWGCCPSVILIRQVGSAHLLFSVLSSLT